MGYRDPLLTLTQLCISAVFLQYCGNSQLNDGKYRDPLLTLTQLLQYSLSQVPVVLFPAAFGVKGNRSIALRPFITRDFMTVRTHTRAHTCITQICTHASIQTLSRTTTRIYALCMCL